MLCFLCCIVVTNATCAYSFLGVCLLAKKVNKKKNTNPFKYLFYRYHSFNNQVVTDPFGRILDCVSGIPGAVHDAAVWDECSLLKRIEKGEIMMEKSLNINGQNIRPFLLGDATYPVRNYLVTPYKQTFANT